MNKWKPPCFNIFFKAVLSQKSSLNRHSDLNNNAKTCRGVLVGISGKDENRALKQKVLSVGFKNSRIKEISNNHIPSLKVEAVGYLQYWYKVEFVEFKTKLNWVVVFFFIEAILPQKSFSKLYCLGVNLGSVSVNCSFPQFLGLLAGLFECRFSILVINSTEAIRSH